MQSQASLKTERSGEEQKRETQRDGSRRRTQPNVPAGFGDGGRGPGTPELRRPLEAGQAREAASPLKPSERSTALMVPGF